MKKEGDVMPRSTSMMRYWPDPTIGWANDAPSKRLVGTAMRVLTQMGPKPRCGLMCRVQLVGPMGHDPLSGQAGRRSPADPDRVMVLVAATGAAFNSLARWATIR